MILHYNFSKIFGSIPNPILVELEKRYSKIKKKYLEGDYEPSELNGAKFCEAVYRLLEWYTSPDKKYTPFGKQISNFNDKNRNFENLSNFNDSVRFHIPKIMNSLYAIRNKRGVGHIGGDIDSNHMDSEFVVAASDWIMAELIRIFHNVDITEASEIVESLIVKKIPLVWDINGIKRILDPSLSYLDKTLVLLYSEYPKSVDEATILNWVEHSNGSIYRRDVLKPAHKKKLIEYNVKNKTVIISPKGRKRVEEEINLEI